MSISIRRSAVQTGCAPQSVSFLTKLGKLVGVRRQRRDLLALDAHLLNDIGVSRTQALEEGRRAMWNVPNHWRN